MTHSDLPIEGELVPIEQPQGLDPITRAEIDVAISTAHRFPRSLQRFKADLMTMATLDEETASGCFFSLPRGGKTVQGPSIRLAEMAVSAYGNIRAGARILGESEDGRYIRAMGMCHDLQNNVLIAMETQRRITDKEGRRYNDDMISTTANAAASVALRNAIYRVVPKALIKGAYDAAVGVVKGSVKSLAESRQKALEALKTLSPALTPDRVCAALGKAGEAELGVEDIVTLRGLYTAIKTGETSVEDAFPPVERAVKAADLLPAAAPVVAPKVQTVAPAPAEAPRKRGPGRPPKIRISMEEPPPPPPPAAPAAPAPIGKDVLEKFKAEVRKGDWFPEDVYDAACAEFEVAELTELTAIQEADLWSFWVAFQSDPSQFGMVEEPA